MIQWQNVSQPSALSFVTNPLFQYPLSAIIWLVMRFAVLLALIQVKKTMNDKKMANMTGSLSFFMEHFL